MNSCRFDDDPKLAAALQRQSREEMKYKLLKDIRIDTAICQMEGWDYRCYLAELKELIDGFLSREVKKDG